jgi:multiple sugar transport system permease protein
MKAYAGVNFRRTRAIQGVLSILPTIVILMFIRFYPIAEAIYRSFTDWNGLYRNNWVGLENYVSIFTNSPFWILLQNSFVLLISVPLQIFFGLLVAVLLYEEVSGWRFFRAIVYVPQIISAVIIGYLFRIAFGLQGPVNRVLWDIGAQFMAVEWLGNRATALFVLVFCLTWFSIGWQAIIILGGMSKLSPSILESASLDGANFWQRTFLVIVPMIARTLEYGAIMSIVWTFTGTFAFIYSITYGGPGYETSTIDYMIYTKFYQASANYGFATALAVVLLVIILGLTFAEMTFTNKVSEWE